MITRQDLDPTEYHPYYTHYINESQPHETIPQVLANGLECSIHFLEQLPADLSLRYQPEKWSIGQIVQHTIDTERVLAYRALRFLRGDSTPLPDFDQDVFAQDFKEFAFAKANLLKALTTTRKATMQLYEEAQTSALARRGMANGNAMSARSIPFIIVGHFAHHERIIKERYLI